MFVSVAPLPIVITVQYRGISLVHNQYQKEARSFASQIGSGAGNKLVRNGEAMESG